MGLLDRFRGRRSRRRPRASGRRGEQGWTIDRSSDDADQKHLQEFLRSRTGVEGYVEPRTSVSEVSLLLIAHDGEWTRRRVPSTDWAHRFAHSHGIPSYDAAVVGYPERMRAYNRRRSQEQKGQQ